MEQRRYYDGMSVIGGGHSYHESSNELSYEEVMNEAYKAPDYLSPHDIDPKYDDFGYDMTEEIHDLSDLLEQSAYVGEYPFDTILEGINDQFADYINMEDKTNYVDIFYNQWNDSKQIAIESPDDTEEIMNVLNQMKDKFVAKVSQLFEEVLTVTIMAVDDESTEEDEVELVMRQIYEFFILGARHNFMEVIATDINLKLVATLDDDEYYRKVDELLQNYSPLVRCMTPTKFIQYTGQTQIVELYEEGTIAGNFLRKYTCKLYQNDEFKVELISHITTLNSIKQQIKQYEEDIENAQQQ